MTRDALATISRIADPVERAARAQELVESLREAIGTAEQVRDAAIREARALPGRLTVDALAQAIGCRRNVIVDATRKRNGGA